MQITAPVIHHPLLAGFYDTTYRLEGMYSSPGTLYLTYFSSQYRFQKGLRMLKALIIQHKITSGVPGGR